MKHTDLKPGEFFVVGDSGCTAIWVVKERIENNIGDVVTVWPAAKELATHGKLILVVSATDVPFRLSPAQSSNLTKKQYHGLYDSRLVEFGFSDPIEEARSRVNNFGNVI